MDDDDPEWVISIKSVFRAPHPPPFGRREGRITEPCPPQTFLPRGPPVHASRLDPPPLSSHSARVAPLNLRGTNSFPPFISQTKTPPRALEKGKKG